MEVKTHNNACIVGGGYGFSVVVVRMVCSWLNSGLEYSSLATETLCLGASCFSFSTSVRLDRHRWQLQLTEPGCCWSACLKMIGEVHGMGTGARTQSMPVERSGVKNVSQSLPIRRSHRVNVLTTRGR